MPVKTGSPWGLLRVCFFVGFLSLWLLLALNLERADITLFVPRSQIESTLPNDTSLNSGFLVNTDGCRIPDLDPMDESVRKYIFDAPQIKCEEQYGPALVESNLTSLYINESVLYHYNITDINQLNCCYTPFWRVEMKKKLSGKYPYDVDSQKAFAKTCTPFSKEVLISDEFVKVECFVNNNSVYVDFHAFIQPKPGIINQTESIHKEAVSVLILGVDAVSRLNLYRQMPQTMKFLKKNLNAVEMAGYNKVDDNTFPNLVPVLTGMSEKELKKSCWPSTQHVFDDCNFIWKNFTSAGFKTAFAEDASWMGIFSYVKRGFRKQPTDYYMRVFNEVSEDEIGFEKRLNAKLCIGPRMTLDTLLDYGNKFIMATKDVLAFSLIWGASLTHDFLNLPKFADSNHKELLENLHSEGIFNRTILIFMSDHGIRWGEIRKTYQGYLEERLPFLFIAYPDWFRSKYTTAVSNLKRNAHKLTSPFDLHEVLLDLVNLTRLEKDVLKLRSEELEKSIPPPRGISLFLPVPASRTCLDSGIVDHWCTCHQSVSIPTNDTLVRRASNYLIKHINSLLVAYPQCAKLTLSKTQSARMEKSISHSTFETSDVGLKDISLTIETTPGKGMFEATVRHNGNTNSFSVVGSVSRINLYGDQSRCVPQYKLRLYCYCIHD